MRACLSHADRCSFDFFFLHPFSASASFCARVRGFALGFDAITGWGAELPEPENVALAGALKIDGCGADGALHASVVVHSGEATGELTHGTSVVHSCAS